MLYVPWLLFCLLLLICLVLLRKVRHLQQMLTVQSDEQSKSLAIITQQTSSQLTSLSTKLSHHRSETTTVLSSMTETLDSVVKRVETNEALIREMQLHDPEIKRYQHAKQLIASGASQEEVIESCGIPAAEVELLFSINQST